MMMMADAVARCTVTSTDHAGHAESRACGRARGYGRVGSDDDDDDHRDCDDDDDADVDADGDVHEHDDGAPQAASGWPSASASENENASESQSQNKSANESDSDCDRVSGCVNGCGCDHGFDRTIGVVDDGDAAVVGWTCPVSCFDRQQAVRSSLPWVARREQAACVWNGSVAKKMRLVGCRHLRPRDLATSTVMRPHRLMLALRAGHGEVGLGARYAVTCAWSGFELASLVRAGLRPVVTAVAQSRHRRLLELLALSTH
jgi:hypothetical protein